MLWSASRVGNTTGPHFRPGPARLMLPKGLPVLVSKGKTGPAVPCGPDGPLYAEHNGRVGVERAGADAAMLWLGRRATDD